MNHRTPYNRLNLWVRATLSTLLLNFGVHVRAADQAPLRAGMIGLDTSHVPAFAKIFNSPKATGDLASIRIVAGYPGGTDIPASRDRVKGFTDQLREGTPDMFFYGIHGIEPLFALMGTGCEMVTRIQSKDTDLVSGVWKNGRVGTYRGIRGNKADFGAVAFGSKAIVQTGKEGGYEELCQEIGRFFKTGKSSIRAEETIEIFAFMEAAEESKRQGGAPVSLASVLAKAKVEAAGKLAK